MSGELARAVQLRTDMDLMAEKAGTLTHVVGSYWATWALPSSAIGNHVDFVFFRDSRIRIPKRGSHD